MSRWERAGYLAVIVALLGAFASTTGATQDSQPAALAQETVWGDRDAHHEFAKNLRSRLDDMADLEGGDLVFGWALLMKDFGLTYDGHLLSDRAEMAPCGFGWHVDCSALGGESWVLRNNVIDEKDIERGRIESGVVEVPKQPLIRFISEAGVSESVPAQADLQRSVLFISVNRKALLVDMSSGDYYRLPFDQPSATKLDRTPDPSALLAPRFVVTASQPSAFW
jgi:hypothetical protein